MSTINTDLFRTIRSKLVADATIISKIKKDRNGRLSIRPGSSIPSGFLLPGITIEVIENASEPLFPVSNDLVRIMFWTDPKAQEQGYSLRKTVADAIIALFNREGSSLNNIDIPTNTGIRVASMLKTSVIFDHDEVIDRNYVEILFDVIRSESESYDPGDAGNQGWV